MCRGWNPLPIPLPCGLISSYLEPCRITQCLPAAQLNTGHGEGWPSGAAAMTEDLSLWKSPVGWYYIAKQSVRCLIIFPPKCYVDTATDCNLATKGILTFFLIFTIYSNSQKACLICFRSNGLVYGERTRGHTMPCLTSLFPICAHLPQTKLWVRTLNGWVIQVRMTMGNQNSYVSRNYIIMVKSFPGSFGGLRKTFKRTLKGGRWVSVWHSMEGHAFKQALLPGARITLS